MPFLAKMTAHFRGSGYSAKKPQSKFICNNDEEYYPLKHENRLYSNKDKIVDDYDDYNRYYDDDDFVREPSSPGYSQRNRREDDNDVDLLYRKSKEKFASWDIRELENRRSPTDRKKSNAHLSRRSPREVADVDAEEIYVNGNSTTSPSRKRNGISCEEERSGSVVHRHERASESADRENGKSRGRKTSESWSEDDDKRSRAKSKERAKPPKNVNNKDQTLKDVETFGSLRKRNEKNAGLNLGFRAIVDKFKSKSDDKEKKEGQRSRKQDFVDVDWRYDNGNSNGHKDIKSPEKFEVYPPKESKTEKNHRIRDYDYEHEPQSRRSPDYEEDDHHSKGRHRETDRSKRRSYAFEVSPEDFDVRIQKYERAPRDDFEVYRRNSFHDRGYKDSDVPPRFSSKDRNGDVVRKSSLKDKDKVSLKRCESTKSKPPKPKVSDRHSRPLTPPIDQQVGIATNFREEAKERSSDPPRKSFSMKEWYESNRQFAAKYLKEHSKVKELSTSDVSAKDEFVFGSAKDSRTLFEIENQESRQVRRESFGDDHSKAVDNGRDPRHASHRGLSSVGHNEAATVVKIRTNAEEDSMKRRGRRRTEEAADGRRRRHRRESAEDEEEAKEEEEAMLRRSETYGRSFVMPARKIWNYRDGV